LQDLEVHLSLYIRVLNNFYTHRKTGRLRATIGEAAFWVPPRLWAYAAENQPDGCFQDYTAAELAILIGYTGDAQALLQALLQVGFMDVDPLRVHDWAEHNGYHSTFAERAAKGAAARWKGKGKGKDKTRKERKGKEPSNPLSNASSIKAEFPPAIESIKLQCAKIGLPDSEGDKFFNFYASKGWMVGRTKMKSWTHALTGWRGRWQESAKAKQSAPESIFNLRTVMEAKAKLAAELHNRHATETGLGTDWNDPAKRAEYVGLKREIKALNERIAGAA